MDVAPTTGLTEVIDVLPDAVDQDAGEVNRRAAPAWVVAALDGIREALDAARVAGGDTTPRLARLVKLVGADADTRDDAIRCAAGLATWEALGSPQPGPEVTFDGRGWSLRYPVAVIRPAQAIAP